MEQEKRIRREIANSNERRRMQSINAGFQSLRTLLPHHDGEKLSKVRALSSPSDRCRAHLAPRRDAAVQTSAPAAGRAAAATGYASAHRSLLKRRALLRRPEREARLREGHSTLRGPLHSIVVDTE
ncbi:hypothetical protein HPB48_009482 [Haemaphysalis longicornis]|uniref:BHLH domain-containing protein n=1 Tax=Haemaphysalis longicornis TaxID=44386 RepID=A0A9J6GD65_HAELO|nr:hypothetical protein HPB48_009482 [Haemaphysalis longicornis]